MKKGRMAILRMVSERKITVKHANSMLQALKRSLRQARSHRFIAGHWRECTIDVLKSLAGSTKKHLETAKVGSFKNLKGILRKQKRILNRTLRSMAREFKQLSH